MGETGSIIVAEHIDPAWAFLFPGINGLVLERDTAMSHSVIIARELGIPVITGIPNLLSILKEGQVVEMNGKTGVIEIIDDQT